jgi:hypothetical protein
LARQKKHRVTVVAPSGEGFLRAPIASDEKRATPEVADAMRALFTQDEVSRLRELRTGLAALSVPLFLAMPNDPAARWLRRAASGRVR